MASPQIEFSGIVFLPSAEEIDRFTEFLQQIASKTVVVCSLCEDSKRPFSEIEKGIASFAQIVQDLPSFLALCQKLSDNVEADEPSFNKFKETQKRLEDAVKQATQRFKDTQASGSHNQDEKIRLSKDLLQDMLKILKETTALLSLQNEWKLDRLKEATANALNLVKQARDAQTLQLDISKLAQQGQVWLNEVCNIAEQREDIIAQLADEATASSFKASIEEIRKNATPIFNASLSTEQRAVHIGAVVKAVSQILNISQSTTVEFSSGLIIQDEKSQRNLDFLAEASERLKRAVQGLYQASKNVRVNHSELVFDEQPLGEGNYGTVWKATWRATIVAVKKVKRDKISEDDYQSFLNEASLMLHLRPHPNVVMMLGVCEDPFCLLFEFVAHGSLESIILDKKNKPPTIEQKCKWMLDIAQGMLHLESNNIVHSDLATRNVLIGNNLIAKVSDFGLSKLADGGRRDNSMVIQRQAGPLKWMAPESLRRRVFSSLSDVWSWGVTCIEILLQDEPYPDMDLVEAALLVVAGKLSPELPPEAPQPLKRILTQCFAFDPNQRPYFETIVQELKAFVK